MAVAPSTHSELPWQSDRWCARRVQGMESELKGSVRLLFQPAEEGGAGGAHMVKEGALEGVSAAFGMHVLPTLPSGQVSSRSGTIMAGSSVFEARILGQGGHAAMPHLTLDPVVAAASGGAARGLAGGGRWRLERGMCVAGCVCVCTWQCVCVCARPPTGVVCVCQCLSVLCVGGEG
jgi:hypothetical protein